MGTNSWSGPLVTLTDAQSARDSLTKAHYFTPNTEIDSQESSEDAVAYLNSLMVIKKIMQRDQSSPKVCMEAFMGVEAVSKN